jgi:hypothetical protein
MRQERTIQATIFEVFAIREGSLTAIESVLAS